MVNVLLVEDSALVSHNLIEMLSGISGVDVIGLTVDEEEAIESFNALLPDVVILDLHLRQGSGFGVLAHIKKSHASVKVVVLSNYANESYIKRCMQGGADYFFDKSFQFFKVGDVLKRMASDGCAGESLRSE